MSCSLNLRNITYIKDDITIFANIVLNLGHEEKIDNTFEIVCQWMDKLLIPKMNKLCASE